MKQPTRISTTQTKTTYFYNQKIKDVKKKDLIYVGNKQLRVLSNQKKNSSGDRVLACVPVFGTSTYIVTLILPKKFRLTVARRRSSTKTKKN